MNSGFRVDNSVRIEANYHAARRATLMGFQYRVDQKTSKRSGICITKKGSKKTYTIGSL
jgi:hypothetical protein